MLNPVKEPVGLWVLGIYQVPCSNIGQTGRSVAEQMKECERDIQFLQPEKSGLAKHCLVNDRQHLGDHGLHKVNQRF